MARATRVISASAADAPSPAADPYDADPNDVDVRATPGSQIGYTRREEASSARAARRPPAVVARKTPLEIRYPDSR